MKKKRIVITGIGPVAPNGIGKRQYWDAIKNGVSGIRKISRFDTNHYSFSVAGEITDLNLSQYLDKKFIARTDRTTQLAAVSVMLALRDANIDISKEKSDEVDLIIGSALSGMEKYSANFYQFIASDKKKMSAYAAVSSFGDACSGILATLFNIRGYAGTVNFACASGTQAIIEAYRRIVLEGTPIVIACGVDSPLLEEVVFAFSVATALSKKADRTPAPYSKTRDGLVLGEGAGSLIVEDLEHALDRKAHIYGEIIGYGNTADASSVSIGDESGNGKILAIKKALTSAELVPEQIDYVNAHGPGTLKGDVIESEIIHAIFGERGAEIPVTSVKSMIGHTQGACGALETIAALASFQEGFISPTINYEEADPKCNINCVPNVAIERRIEHILKQSFGFGGKNAILILRKYQHVDK